MRLVDPEWGGDFVAAFVSMRLARPPHSHECGYEDKGFDRASARPKAEYAEVRFPRSKAQRRFRVGRPAALVPRREDAVPVGIYGTSLAAWREQRLPPRSRSVPCPTPTVIRASRW